MKTLQVNETINDIRWHFCKDKDGIDMTAKELIELLQRVDGDTRIMVLGNCDIRKPITLWDWTDTHGAVVLVEGHTQD